VWTEPVANRFTSSVVLEQEQTILDFAARYATEPPAPSTTIEPGAMDALQTEAAAAVAGGDGLVIVVGPAGAGKTTMLAAAFTDLHTHARPVYGVAPTGKAAQVLARETGIPADTVAKLLHEWRPDGPGPQAAWRLAAGTTVIVDEAGLVATGDLYCLTQLATQQRWRLVLVGDPRQLAAVGRSGMFEELVRTHPAVELEQLYRFTETWEADVTLRLRAGDPRVLDTYFAHDRIRAGTLDDHLKTLTAAWFDERRGGGTLAITVATNEHAGLVNTTIQTARINAGELDSTRQAATAGGVVYVGDVIATRHNQRSLRTSNGGTVRNRDRWTITGIDDRTGALTASRLGLGDTVTLPAGYVAEWVELAYAATDYGNQGDTFTASINLISDATTARGLYVAMTRGRLTNTALVITDTPDPNEARDTLSRVLATDRADTPAIVQQRELANSTPAPGSSPTAEPSALKALVPIPEWFDSYRNSVRQELDDAVDCAERVNVRNDARVVELQQLRAALRAVEEQCRPLDAQLASAKATVAQRCKGRQAATDELAHASVWQRRSAKARLAVTIEDHGMARADLAQLEQDFRPQVQARQSLRHRIGELERRAFDDSILDRNTNTSSHIAYLQRVSEAVDTWHDWATGTRVPVGDLRDTYAALRFGLEHDWLRDDPRSQLANTLQSWADEAGLHITTVRPTPELPARQLGIETS
jgi:hypothetical protein